jgi:anti-sigma regulatory factor (Ser/Thr protein kinase)
MCGEHGTHSTDTAAVAGRPRSCGPSSPAEARQAVRDALEGRFQGHDPRGDDDAVGDALLVTSELTSNAILHGGGVTDFEVRLVDHAVQVSVSDGSDQVPETKQRVDEQGRMRVGGHGWPIICRLARDIVVSSLRPSGKRITAIVPLALV